MDAHKESKDTEFNKEFKIIYLHSKNRTKTVIFKKTVGKK
jgi:hypothetical protein